MVRIFLNFLIPPCLTVTEIIDLDFRISIVHSLYVKVKTLLSLVNLTKFENFGENKFNAFPRANLVQATPHLRLTEYE